MGISRYKTNGTKKSPDGRTVYKARRLKNIPKSNEDKYVVSQTGDRLDTLANEYYGSSSYWWVIATANNIHDGKLGLPDGTILRIPANHLDIVKNELNNK
jgi:nucleoid-associated protein YgaU